MNKRMNENKKVDYVLVNGVKYYDMKAAWKAVERANKGSK
jgi:hypothetical protein